MRVILASKSPRRKELMKYITDNYEVIVSDVDESFVEDLTLIEQSERLAYIKAKKVFDMCDGDRIVIGSDTMVLKDDKIYGKPKDRNDAINMLNDLKNSRHQVITSLAVLIKNSKNYKEYIDYDVTDVYFKDITEAEIINWVDSGECFDKAGAYAIQGKFGVFIDRIVGNYFTVVGLPIHKLYEAIKKYI